jgi:hypothetical protein
LQCWIKSSLKRGSFIQRRQDEKGNQKANGQKNKKSMGIEVRGSKSPFMVKGCTGFGGLNGVVGQGRGLWKHVRVAIKRRGWWWPCPLDPFLNPILSVENSIISSGFPIPNT